MKRLIVCCDGTWQSLDNGWPTNVQRIAQFILPTASDGATQIVYYDSGVGTRGLLDRLTGGAFGHGLDIEIREAYRFLSLNYEADDEIYLFGFSRGAYTVRSLAGLIYSSGIARRSKIRAIPRAMEIYRDREIHPDDDEAINFRETNSIETATQRPTIYFLGVWDTVGALGVPDAIPILPLDDALGEKYKFHDTELGGHIMHARHAVAIDERRKVFDYTPMSPPDSPMSGHSLREVWFPGTHGCVGGGERANRGLADGALIWMMNESRSAGLEFSQEEVDAYTKPDPLSPFAPQTGLRHQLLGQDIDRDGPKSVDDVSTEAKTRWSSYDMDMKSYRPETLKHLADDLD